MRLTLESKKLISFYKPGKRIKTNYSFFREIFPVPRKKISKKKTNTFKKRTQLRAYFNNIDTCRSNPKMKQKDTMIKILKKLGKEHRNILDKIYIDFKFPENKKIIVDRFLSNQIYSLSFNECVEWINLNGIELLRAIYVLYLDRKLPSDIVGLLGYYPQIRGEFTSLDIQNEIDIGLKNSKKVQFERDGITLDLLIFSDKKVKLGDDFLERCFYLDLLLKKRTRINLEIWLSNKKKDLPPPRDIKYIGPREVNSGCTSFSMEGNNVSVWRKEEFPKVLVHELIHSLELEKHNDYGQVEEFIYHHFDIQRTNKLNVFECYVELMAEIVNIILLDRKKFSKLINLELEHCLFQVGKILNYYGYTSWEEIYREGGWIEGDKTGKYQQRSNVFSYFIFRAMVMYNLDDFMGLCFEKNTRHFMKQDFKSIELLNIVKKTLHDTDFEKIINRYINLNKKNYKSEDIIYRNLRMTCVEGLLF
jgi:hypothetical protein